MDLDLPGSADGISVTVGRDAGAALGPLEAAW
jgi:hypothetical protein